jgi:hypothetical protein
VREKGRETQGPAFPRKGSKKRVNEEAGSDRLLPLKKMRLDTTIPSATPITLVTTSAPYTAQAMFDYVDVLQNKEDTAVPHTTSSEDDIMPDLCEPHDGQRIQSKYPGPY